MAQQPMRPPTPQKFTGAIRRVEPLTVQRVMKFGNNVIPLGPPIPYQEATHQFRRVGSLILDCFEGNSTNNANPDVPTDGLYGETFIPTAPGNRWFFGDGPTSAFVNTNLIRRYWNVFPGTANKSATGIDFLLHNNSFNNTESITEVLFFTSGDPFDPSSPVAPTNFNPGIKLTYNPIAPGSSIYSNVDLTTAPLQMPTTSQGWYQMVFASGDDANGNPIEANSAQPLYWGTKALNASVVSDLEYMDGALGDGSDRTGMADQLFTWDFGYYSTPTAYTIARGVETSTHDVNRLTGTPGNNVVISNRLQSNLVANNAELTATVTLDPATPAISSLRLLRAQVVCKANALPLSSSLMTISMLNNTTGSFVTLYSGPAVNVGANGTVITTLPALQGLSIPNLPGFPSPAITDIPKFIATDGAGNRTVQIKVGVRQGLSTGVGWNLTVNRIQVVASTIGPNPVAPGVAFSTNL